MIVRVVMVRGNEGLKNKDVNATSYKLKYVRERERERERESLQWC